MENENYEGAYIYDGEGLKDAISLFRVDSVKKVPKARVIGAPVETGQITFDNKVIDPYDLIVRGTLVLDANGSYKSAKQRIDKMFEERDFKFFSVRDGVDAYKPLVLVSAPQERGIPQVDWLQYELVFTHVMKVQEDGKTTSSSNSENSDFRNTGYTSGSRQ